MKGFGATARGGKYESEGNGMSSGMGQLVTCTMEHIRSMKAEG
jgi:hypothetical protein